MNAQNSWKSSVSLSSTSCARNSIAFCRIPTSKLSSSSVFAVSLARYFGRLQVSAAGAGAAAGAPGFWSSGVAAWLRKAAKSASGMVGRARLASEG